MFRFLPEQASEHAAEVDWLHNIITDLSVFFTVAIVGAMLLFAVRYRRSANPQRVTPQILGSHTLEIIWTVVPTLICIFIAYEGVAIFKHMKRIDPAAMTINVTAKKWNWDFEYENGKHTTDEFVLPVDRPVRIVLTSTDVLHSFFIPSMRVKSDAIKGQYTYVAFKPIKTGEYHTFCTEYCGTNHSAMMAKLRVVSQGEFERWLSDRSEAKLAPADRGKKLYVEKGCQSCHSLDGSRKVGPSWLGLWEKEEVMTNGSTVKVDENYLRESLLNPNKLVVQGYAPVMSAYYLGEPGTSAPGSGQAVESLRLSESDITALIAFIKTLDASSAPKAAATPAAPAEDLSKLSPEARGKLIYEKGKGAAAPCSACHSLDGTKLVGPTFKGVYGRSAKWADGTAYTVTDSYIKESILNPNAHIVEGYAPGMLQYQGLLADSDIEDLTAFLKTVK